MPVVDVHAHYVSPALVDQITQGAFAPHLQPVTANGGTCCQFPTHTTTRPLFHKLMDLDERVRYMDEVGVDIQVLSTWADLYGYDLPEDAATAYHTRVNEGLARAAEQHPGRFQFLASLPLPWGAAAARVLEDAVQRLGALGSMIGTNVRDANLDDERLQPVWAASTRLGVPVELHPIDVAGQDRLGRYYLTNLLGNPFDTNIAATSLVLGGVLDRHPDLRVLLVHGGGYFPYAVGRLDHGYAVRPETRTSQQPPSAYVRRFFYDTIVYQPQTLKALADLVGADRLLLGSDYPFDMEPPAVVEQVRATLGDRAQAILETNPSVALPFSGRLQATSGRA